MPSGLVPISDGLEAGNRFLRDFGHAALVSGVAEVDAAAERPHLTSGTQPFDLEGASVRGNGGAVRRGGFQQDLGLELRDEERVVVLLEPTATARGVASGSGCRNRRIGTGVDFQHKLPHGVGHPLILRSDSSMMMENTWHTKS